MFYFTYGSEISDLENNNFDNKMCIVNDLKFN